VLFIRIHHQASGRSRPGWLIACGDATSTKGVSVEHHLVINAGLAPSKSATDCGIRCCRCRRAYLVLVQGYGDTDQHGATKPGPCEVADDVCGEHLTLRLRAAHCETNLMVTGGGKQACSGHHTNVAIAKPAICQHVVVAGTSTPTNALCGRCENPYCGGRDRLASETPATQDGRRRGSETPPSGEAALAHGDDEMSGFSGFLPCRRASAPAGRPR